MAYVSVPKDLTKVKNKVAFNLTRRQIICFGAAAAVGIPFYLLARGTIGDSAAVMGMVILMVPAFLFAMYERDGMPLELPPERLCKPNDPGHGPLPSVRPRQERTQPG